MIFLLLPTIFAQTFIELGKTYQEMIRPWQGESKYRIYQLNLTEIIPDADLVLIARSLNSRGDPNIYVSNSNPTPLQKQDAEIVSCASRGLDICIVDKSLLKANLTYYIGVVCEGFCRFSFKAMYDKEKQMTNNDDLEFRFNQSDNAGIVTISNNLTGTETSLDIIIEIRNVFEMEEAFNSYLSIGSKKPSSESFNYKGVDSFGGIQVISISGEDLHQQLFTLVVEAQEGALVAIRTRCYGVVRQINTYESVEVTLKKDQSQIFKIEISQYMTEMYTNDEAINFSLSPFSGYAYLFVNPDTQPPILDSYRFSYKDSIGDDLVITKSELQAMKVRGDVFYIVVYGVTEISSSMLRVQLINKNSMMLELNKPTSGKLAKKEIISYQFRLQGPKDHEVQISLKTFQANSDMIVKQCDNYDCVVSQEDITQREQKYKVQQGEMFLYSQSQGDDFLVFTFNSTYCNSLFQKYCLYTIGIYPDEDLKEDQFASYQILVTFREHRKRLKENTPYKEFLAKDLTSYFKFTILEGDNPHRLSFILTPIQGQPQMYISQSDKKPSKDSFEAASGFDNVINFGGRQQGPVKSGDYYVAVVGQTASIYLLTAQVFRQWTDFQTIGKYPWQYVQIFEGDPHFYRPNSTQDVGLFKIDLNHYRDQQYDYKQNVRIELICDLDQYDLYASDQPEVDNSKSRWKAVNKEILIDQMDKDYPQIVFLKVVPKPLDGTISYAEYNILFQVGDYKTIDLVIGQNYYDYIRADQVMYFQVPYHNHEDLIVQKVVHGLGQLAVEAIVQYGSQSDFMLDKSSLIVKGSSLETDNCKPTPQQPFFFCYLYIQLTGRQNASFSLLVYSDTTNLELQEGYQILKKVPEVFDKYYFYVSSQFAEIIVQSIYAQLTIYANIETHTNTSNVVTDEYPTPETAQLQSREKKYYYDSSLFISYQHLEQHKCFEPGNRCVIKLSVYRSSLEQKDILIKMDYTIVYKSYFQPIWPNTQVIGACENNTYQFYQLDVPSNITFMIVVTPLGDGDPDLYVKKNQLPTKDDYDFSSAQWAGDQIIVEKGNKVDSNNAGTYYIGVYSQQNMTFTIQVRFGDIQYYRVYSQVPFNLILKSGSISYFDFLNYDDKNFRILLSSNNGRPKMYIDTYTTENDLQNSLNKQLVDFNLNNNKQGYTNYYMIDRSNKFYATNTHFLIAVTVEVDTDFTLLVNPVNEPIYLTNNLIQYNQFEDGEQQAYKYYIEGNFEINVDIKEGIIRMHYVQNDTLSEEVMKEARSERYDANEMRSKGAKLHNFFKVEYDPTKSYIYTILVVCEKAAKFDLWVRSYKTQQELKIGVPFSFWLLKMDNPRVFMFRVGADSQKQKFSVSITNNNQDYMDRSKALQHPIIEVLRDQNENPYYEDPSHEFYKATKVEEVSTELSHFVEFEDVAGLYYIRVSTQVNGNQEYTITVGDNLIGVLSPQVPRTVYGAPGFIHPWEAYIPYGKKLYVTVELCGGQVGVYGSKDKNKISIGLFEKSLDHAHNKMLTGFFDPGEGVYYVGSKLLKAYHNQDKAAYEIMGQLMDKEKDDPATYFEPGEDGELTWKVDENNYLNVTFAPINQLVRDGKSWAWQRVDYYLVTQVKQVDDESPINYCLRSSSSPNVRIIKNALYQNGTNLGAQLDFKPDQQTQFSVVARVFTSNDNFGTFEVNFNYQQAYVNFTHLQNFRMRRIFRYVIPIIFIIGVSLIAYLWNSNRKLKKMLKYEMQDPENRIQPILNNNAQESAIEMNYRGLSDQK